MKINMKFSKESDYALRIILFLSKAPEFISAHEVIEFCKIPQSFGLKIISKLVKAKLLSSVVGVNGGIILAKSPKDISVFDVINSIENLTLKDCIDNPELCIWRNGNCSICVELKKLKIEFIKKLKDLNFQYLVEKDKKIRRSE